MHPSADDSRPRTVWKPSRTGPHQIEKPLYCGGPNYDALYFEELREAKEREQREAEAREQAEREAQATKTRARRRHTDAGDEDDDIAAETEKRNARYAMKLLCQDDDAWGGGSAGQGVLG